MKDLKTFYFEYKDKISKKYRKDLEFLFRERLQLSSVELQFSEKKLIESEIKILEQDVSQLCLGRPLAYILRTQDFLDFRYYVDERTFIPRPETEYLIYLVVNKILKTLKPAPIIMDIGAGTGCMGISLLKKRPKGQCVFVESSNLAREVLKINLERSQINTNRYYICNSLEEAQHMCRKKFISIDVVVSNPPYINRGDSLVEDSVINYEPHEALFAERGGLEYLFEWSDWAIKEVCDLGGFAFFEFGLNQDLFLRERFENRDISFEFLKDQYGKNRFLFLCKEYV